MQRIGDFIRCMYPENTDCFARTERTECTCLRDCFFPDMKCHFYRPKAEVDAENAEIAKKTAGKVWWK